MWRFLGSRGPVVVFFGICRYFPESLLAQRSSNVNLHMLTRNNADAMGDIGSGKNQGDGVEGLGFGDPDDEFF